MRTSELIISLRQEDGSSYAAGLMQQAADSLVQKDSLLAEMAAALKELLDDAGALVPLKIEIDSISKAQEVVAKYEAQKGEGNG